MLIPYLFCPGAIANTSRHLALIGCLLASAPVFAASSYTVTDLGGLGGYDTLPSDINNAGQVVGGSATGAFYDYVDTSVEPPVTYQFPVYHAFRFDRGGMHDLGTLGGTNSYANSINEDGEIAGHSDTSGDLERHGFRYDKKGLSDIATLGGTFAIAWSINNSGKVVGTSNLAGDAAFHPFRQNRNGAAPRDLGTLGGTWAGAIGINAAGQIAGGSYLPGDAVYHATFINDPKTGEMSDLGTLGGDNSDAFVGTGNVINNAGQVIGWSETGSFYDYTDTSVSPPSIIRLPVTHAFRSRPNGGLPLQDLGTLGGHNSTPLGINNVGIVVGGSETAELDAGGFPVFHAFLHDGCRMRDLNVGLNLPAGTYLYYATAINDRGQIVAYGSDSHGYLLTPAGGSVARGAGRCSS